MSKRKSHKRYQMGKKGTAKMEKTMHEWKHGALHSGSKRGPKVTSQKQAVAIGLSQARRAGARIPHKRGGKRS
jgi:hypothetical protein